MAFKSVVLKSVKKYCAGWVSGCKSRFKDCLQQSKRLTTTIRHVSTVHKRTQCLRFFSLMEWSLTVCTKLTWIGQKCYFVDFQLSAIRLLNGNIPSKHHSCRAIDGHIDKLNGIYVEVREPIGSVCFIEIGDISAKSVQKSWIRV